jgi:hypothetical protein
MVARERSNRPSEQAVPFYCWTPDVRRLTGPGGAGRFPAGGAAGRTGPAAGGPVFPT